MTEKYNRDAEHRRANVHRKALRRRRARVTLVSTVMGELSLHGMSCGEAYDRVASRSAPKGWASDPQRFYDTIARWLATARPGDMWRFTDRNALIMQRSR